MKPFEMLHIEDSELRMTLSSYYLKGDTGQWWKYAKGRVEPTWEAFVVAFQDKYLPPTAREVEVRISRSQTTQYVHGRV